jgi:hypothetical protein
MALQKTELRKFFPAIVTLKGAVLLTVMQHHVFFQVVLLVKHLGIGTGNCKIQAQEIVKYRYRHKKL